MQDADCSQLLVWLMHVKGWERIRCFYCILLRIINFWPVSASSQSNSSDKAHLLLIGTKFYFPCKFSTIAILHLLPCGWYITYFIHKQFQCYDYLLTTGALAHVARVETHYTTAKLSIFFVVHQHVSQYLSSQTVPQN